MNNDGPFFPRGQVFGDAKKQAYVLTEQLAKKYYDAIYTYEFKQLGDKEDAEDITQEVFLRLQEHLLSKGNTIENARAWLYAVARNCNSDFYQRKKKRSAIVSLENDKNQLIESLAASDNVETEVIYRDDLQRTTEKIKTLGKRNRAVAELTSQGFSIPEISQQLEQQDSTTRSCLTRSRKSIKNQIQ